MTNLSPGAKDIKALAKMLDEGKFSSATDMAKAALEYAFEAYEDRARFIIVGQLIYDPDSGFVKDSGDRIAFGPYGTLGTAQAAHEQLTGTAGTTGSTATNEEFRSWLVPLRSITPAAWFRERRKIKMQAEDVPLTPAEKLIIRYNPENCHLWGLSPDGTRLKSAV